MNVKHLHTVLQDTRISLAARFLWVYAYVELSSIGHYPPTHKITEVLGMDRSSIRQAFAELKVYSLAGQGPPNYVMFDPVTPTHVKESGLKSFNGSNPAVTLLTEFKRAYRSVKRSKCHRSSSDYSVARGIIKEFGLRKALILLPAFFSEKGSSLVKFREYVQRKSK